MPDNNQKELVITIEEDLHARLKIALFYDRLGQSQFMRHIINGYLDNNPLLRAFINEVLESKLSVAKKRNRKKDSLEVEETNKNFALDEDDIENIFDLIERENPDL